MGQLSDAQTLLARVQNLERELLDDDTLVSDGVVDDAEVRRRVEAAFPDPDTQAEFLEQLSWTSATPFGCIVGLTPDVAASIRPLGFTKFCTKWCPGDAFTVG